MLAQPDRDAVEVSDDLVTVNKEHKDVGKADVAGVEIRVSTDSPVPVAFRMVEQFPEGVSMDDIAVHPQFSPEKWTVSESERRMVFEDVVDPDEEVVTLYGVLEAKYDGLGPFMGKPEIAVSQQVDPGTSTEGTDRLFRGGAATAEAPRTQPADGAIDVDRLIENGDDEPGPTADVEPSEPAGPEPTAADGTEPSTDVRPGEPSEGETSGQRPVTAEPQSSSNPEQADGDATAPSPDDRSGDETFVFQGTGSGSADASEATLGQVEGPTASAGSTGAHDPPAESVDLGNASVVTAFIDELEREELSDEQLAALREGLDLEPAESMRLRVNHLQSEVVNLSAYADEFERFVDEEGSLTGVLDEFRAELDRMEAQVDDLSADVSAAAEERTELCDYVDRLERELATLRESHESSVGQLSSRIDDVEAESAAAEEAAAIREELEAERAWRRKVVASLEALAEDAADRQFEW